MKKEKSLFQNFLNIISWVFLGIFVVALIFTAAGNLNVIGGYKSLLVQSGSMEPTIMTGDVVITARSLNYRINDVVTFNDSEGYITTHRLTEIKEDEPEEQYMTKGDANRVQDSEAVAKNQIIGKVVLVVPKFGYFISFVRSPGGMVIFIFFPAILIVVDELIKIAAAAKEKKNFL